MAFYEDFLCPACGNFERRFGPTVSKLIDSGAIAADYYMVGLLSRPQNEDYSSRAGNAAYCVADESIDAFRRFHTALYTKEIQPSETGTTFPDNAKLIELAREAGVVGKVPECIKAGKYTAMVDGLVTAAGIHATPTIRINGQDYQWSTPEALVDKIKEIVGDVPGTRLGCDPSGVVTATASAKPGEPVEDSTSPSRRAATVPTASAWWVLIAGVIGLIASATLTVEKIEILLNPSYVPSCNLNPIVSCGSVMTTPQASVLGFPNSLIGIAAFTVITVTGVLAVAKVPLPQWYWVGIAARDSGRAPGSCTG